MRRVSKYHNRRTVVGGEVFDSRAEARRYGELLIRERAGEVRDIKRQVPYVLIDAQYEEQPTGEVHKKGKLAGQPKYKRVCVERAVKYIADFVYQEKKVAYTEDGTTPLYEFWSTVVEDTKGVRTEAYKIKRKLMLKVHRIKIREVDYARVRTVKIQASPRKKKMS